ncbi:MAG TPA: hypothetical protein VGJ79_05250 [Candidatus Dormibacteraeota bacterium]
MTRTSLQRLDDFRLITPSPVGPVTRQRVMSVADRNDPREQRNPVSAQPVGITAAIEALMVMTNDWQNIRGRLEVLEDALSDSRVRTHLLFFICVEWSRFTED